jgi:pimeloyl-ACP methyl ester carboxylesterase
VDTVIVAHGLWMPGFETGLLRRRIESRGFKTRLFKYSTTGVALDDNMLALARFVREQPGTVHLVGYSLGGVLAVRMLQRGDYPQVARVVCLGAPLKGTQVGARFAALPGGRRLIGRSALDLLAEAPLPPWSAPPPLGIVAGRIGIGLGRMLTDFGAGNDGTVAIAETELEGASDRIVLPVSHTTMMFSRMVAEQTARFLRTARFDHGA